MLANTQARAEITPLVKNRLSTPGGKTVFTAACFSGTDKEWSLAPLQEPGDPARHPQLTHKIRSAMRHLGADRIYAPSPVDFNGVIIRPAELSRVMVLGHVILLLRNGNLKADGTFLRSGGDAGAFSAWGCSVIAATFGEHLIFAHAGRDCVINRKRVLGEPGARPFESVVDSIVGAFRQLGAPGEGPLRGLHVWPLYSVRPDKFMHRYDDPVHSEYNRKLGPYLDSLGLSGGYRRWTEGVELDIPAVIMLQFIRHGVPVGNIHMEAKYLPDGLPTSGSGRYLVAVVRH